MGDLASTSFSSSCSCPLIRLQPQLAVKHNIAHFMPSQKSFHGSYTRHLDFARTSARPRWHLEQVAAINLITLGVATGEFQVGCEEEEMAEGLLLQPASDGNEETEEAQQASDTETSLVLATHAIMGTLAGVNYASEVPGQVRGDATDTPAASSQIIVQAQKERMMKRKTQQLTYLFAALASSVGITSLAGASVYCRFAWQMQGGGDVPWTEMCGTFSLALGAAVGMEYWARWAHRVLWHASLWSMHESHHQPRDGPFELNDVFAIINAVPAIALMAFGFLNKGLVPGLCFGAGLGITMFGIAYMFVHDGLVHRRFPVGPIADVPYFQKVAAAHQLHHADKFNGVPYGLFLGPMELEEVGGRIELEKVLQKRKRENRNPIIG